MSTNYVDGVSNVASIAGNVRLDLFRYELDQDAKDGRRQENVEQLVMSHEGFLESYKRMTQLFNALAKNGVYKVKEGEEVAKEDKKEKAAK